MGLLPIYIHPIFLTDSPNLVGSDQRQSELPYEASLILDNRFPLVELVLHKSSSNSQILL